LYQPGAFFRHVFGEDADGYLVAFSGQQARLDNPGAPTNQLTDIRQEYFRYPELGQAAEEYLLEQSEAGRDAYVGVHLFEKSGNRRAANALPRVTTLWLDEDEGSYPDEGPEPTAEIASSSNRRQLYWRLTHPVAAQWAVAMNRRIAHWAGGDIGKAGLASVLRVPGTRNYKRHPRIDVVTMRLTGSGPWPPEVMEQAIPPLPRSSTPTPSRKKVEPYDGPELELAEFLDDVEIIGEVPDGLGKKLAVVCPWVEQHTGGDRSGTRVGHREGGGFWFHCDHAHCCERTWADFREAVQQIYRRQKKLQLMKKGRYYG
jgi:hypothetical protein